MKRFILSLFAVVAVCSAMAQPPRGMMPPPPPQGGQEQPSDRSIAKRYEHLKTALEMTDEQLEKFAPVYSAYQREVRGIRKDLKTLMDSYKGETIDEKIAFKLVMAQLNADADVIRCKKEYMRVFKDYLTPDQMSKIFLVENRPPRKPHGDNRGEHPAPLGEHPTPPQR